MPPVPPIPAHLSTPAKSSENSKISSPKLLPDIPSATNNFEDASVARKPNQGEMVAAEVDVKANAANAIMKTPPAVDRARLDEYHDIEVCGFLKWSSEADSHRAYCLHHHHLGDLHHERSTLSKRPVRNHL